MEGSGQPPHEGWYPDPSDPSNPEFFRYFDGQQWTKYTQHVPQRRTPWWSSQVSGDTARRTVFAPLLTLAAVIAAVVIALLHPSVSVPFAGTQDCGASSWTLWQDGANGYGVYTAGSPDAALARECVTAGDNRMWIALGLGVFGLFGGVIVGRWERSRSA